MRSYRIRCLLVDFPDWTYARLETLPRGMFLVSFRAAPQQATRSWAVVFDQEGMPRWWFNPPTSTSGAPTDGHEYTRLENGNVLIDTYRPRTGVDLTSVGGPRDAGVLDGEIQEFTPSGKVVWTWNSGDHVPLEDTPPRWWKRILGNPHPDADGNERYDIFHLNSIEPRGPGMLVVSSRHTDKVFGISRKTGGILWNFGGRPDPRSLKVEGTDPLADYPIAGNHDTRIAGNLLSVHDSGTNLGRSPRALRYRIDLKAGTATYAGQFTDPAIRRSHCCGGFTRCARSATGSGQ